MQLAPRLLETPPACWPALLAADPNATPAHRPEVWNAFAVAMRMEVRVVVAEADGVIAGGSPVLLERRGAWMWLHALPMLLPAAPIARDGLRGDVDLAVARGFGMLQASTCAVGGEWALYRPEAEPPNELVVAAVAGETRQLDAAIVDLRGGLEAARARMHRKARQDLRPAARRLRFAESAGALDEAYALYTRQARGWSAHRPLPIELSRRLLSRQARDGEPAARLFTARDARGLLAATLALDGHHETLLWWSGSHTDARARQAFGFLLWSVVEWAHAAGRRRVNLGASTGLDPVAAFKRSLGATTCPYPVRWLDATAAPPLGRAVAAIQRRVRRGRPRGRGA